MFKKNLPDNIISALDKEIIFLQDQAISANMATELARLLEKRRGYFLDLSSNPLSNEGGLAIAKLYANGLGLSKAFITNNAVKAILTNQNLICLNLRGNAISDEAFSKHDDLSELKKLEALDLSQTAITSTTLDSLTKLPHLRILIIDFNDKLSQEAVRNLMSMPSLCYLQADGCKLDEAMQEAIKAFNKKNQNDTIEVMSRQQFVRPSSPDYIYPKPKKSAPGCIIQ